MPLTWSSNDNWLYIGSLMVIRAHLCTSTAAHQLLDPPTLLLYPLMMVDDKGGTASGASPECSLSVWEIVYYVWKQTSFIIIVGQSSLWWAYYEYSVSYTFSIRVCLYDFIMWHAYSLVIHKQMWLVRRQECKNVGVRLHIWSVYIPHQPCLMGVEALDLLREEPMAFDPNTDQQLSLPAAMEGWLWNRLYCCLVTTTKDGLHWSLILRLSPPTDWPFDNWSKMHCRKFIM